MTKFILPLVVLLLAFGSVGAQTQEPEQSIAQKHFSDIQMVNQDGEKMRFYSNLLQGKLDPAGYKLLYVMPRYQMSKEDLDDLVVYLKRLGTDVDPGVTENKIVIGMAFPTIGPVGELSLATRDVIAAAFAETNSQGGVYGRQLALKSIAVDTNAITRADVEKLIKDEKVFALAGMMIAGVENCHGRSEREKIRAREWLGWDQSMKRLVNLES